MRITKKEAKNIFEAIHYALGSEWPYPGVPEFTDRLRNYFNDESEEGDWTTEPPEEAGWWPVKYDDSPLGELVRFFILDGVTYAEVHLWSEDSGYDDDGCEDWNILVEERSATRHTVKITLPE
jgi:hypothetical protein